MERRKRYMLCYNPADAKKDKEMREQTIARLVAELAHVKQLKEAPHTKATCELRSNKSMGRYLKQKADGTLSINKAKIKAEERLDGKFLLLTSDDSYLPKTLPLDTSSS